MPLRCSLHRVLNRYLPLFFRGWSTGQQWANVNLIRNQKRRHSMQTFKARYIASNHVFVRRKLIFAMKKDVARWPE